MSSPSSRTSPTARWPGYSAYMRLNTRSSVDLPQPEGPMNAVMAAIGQRQVDVLQRLDLAVDRNRGCCTSNLIDRRLAHGTCCQRPRIAPCACVRNGFVLHAHRPALPVCSMETITRATMLSVRIVTRDQQGAGPGQLLPVLVRAQRKLEDHHRQAGHRRVQVGAPELVVQRGEQQRRGLAAQAGHRQQQARSRCRCAPPDTPRQRWCARDGRRAPWRHPSCPAAPGAACLRWCAPLPVSPASPARRRPHSAEKCPMRTTISSYTNRPTMMDGADSSTSLMKRMTLLMRECRPYSAR